MTPIILTGSPSPTQTLPSLDLKAAPAGQG